MTFTRDDRTVLGDDPQKVARKLHEAGADVIGVNCSGGPAQLLRILKHMRQAVPDRHGSGSSPTPAGRSRSAGASCIRRTRITLAIMPSPSARPARSVVGGCCGTTPQHIAAMRKALDAAPGRRPRLQRDRAARRGGNGRASRDSPPNSRKNCGAGRFAISRRDGSAARPLDPQADRRRIACWPRPART